MSVGNANNCESNVYRIKKIKFNGPCDIVRLSVADNGPCALVALANVLLLRGSMSFPGTQTTISSTDLLEHIADLLLSVAPVGTALQDTRAQYFDSATALQDKRAQHLDSATALQDRRAQYFDSATSPIGAALPDFHARQLNSALTFLEHLPRGMEVDVKFSGVASFSPSPGLEMFSLLEVPLYHAWLLDPADTDMADVVGDLSHAELIDKIITYINSDDPFKMRRANQAQEFLGAAPNQMTTYGLTQLTLNMEEGGLGVLYKNHGFVTICKHNGVIYQLVNHEGHLYRDDIVWMTLDSVDGVGTFVNHDFENENRITIVDDHKTRENLHPAESTDVKIEDMASTDTRLGGVGNNPGLVDLDHVVEFIDESSGFLEGLDCKKPKVCPSGHQLKEVPVSVRLQEQRSGYGGWRCSSCKNDTLGPDLGTRFRCDHHKVKNNTTQLVVSLRSDDGWKGSIECDFDLCGECFYAKQTRMDTIDVTEENLEYRKHVTENIKELLLEHPNGIFELNFLAIYRDAVGEKIDFQKLGYPSQKSNLLKLLHTLSGSVVELVYQCNRGTIGLYIKPSKSLLHEIHQSRIEQLSLLNALEFPDEHLPNQFLHNTVWGVRKQVQYPPGLKEGNSLDIIVSHVTSPAKFWFQLRGQETSDALESLMNDMESFYRNDEKKYRLDLGNPRDQCKPGAILAAPYQDNETYDFHRVHVNKIFANNVNKVEVFYLDYGTIEKIPISCLRILPEKFCRLPAQALEGKLWGLAVPSGSKTWPKEATQRFLKLVAPVNDAGFGCYSIVKRIQSDASNRVLHLQLIDAVTTKSPEGLSINDQLVHEGLASGVQICEEEISILPVRAEGAAASLFPQCNASIQHSNDKIKGIEEDKCVFDANNNENMEEAISVNNNSVAGSNTKILINRVNITENLSVILLIDEGKILLSSGDISALMPSWRGKDLLAKMLQLRRVSIHSVDILQGEDKFQQIMNFGLKPTENLDNVKVFQLYRIIDVPKLVTMFNKDVQSGKKIIEAVDKIKQDCEAFQEG